MSKQEPVAWRVYYEVNDHYIIFQQFPDGLKQIDNQHDIEPLYTAPPKRKPLSDEEIAKLLSVPLTFVKESSIDRLVTLIRKVEKAHGIGVEE